MKKRIIPAILMICAMMLLMIGVASADVTFSVDGIAVIEDGSVTSNTSGDGWTYVGSETSGTLTLNGATITDVYVGAPIFINDTSFSLTIQLIGENKIIGGSNNSGIQALCQSLTIDGSDDGTLTVEGGKHGISNAFDGNVRLTIQNVKKLEAKGNIREAIQMGSITIEKSNVIATTTNTGSDDAIYAEDDLTITGSTVTAECAKGRAIKSNLGSINISDSNVIATSNDFASSNNSMGIYALKAIAISGNSLVTAKGANYGILTDNKYTEDIGETKGNGIHIKDELGILNPVGGEEGKDNGMYSTILNSEGNIAKEVTIRKSVKIAASANAAEGGTVTGAGAYLKAETATVKATPADGYAFANWTEDGTVVSTEAEYSFTVTVARTLVANFKKLMTNKDISITIPSQSQTYNGSDLTPTVTVKDGENVLTADTDYTVSYRKNGIDVDQMIDANTYTVVLTGQGSYTGTAVQEFTITPAGVTLTANSGTETYDGQEKRVSGFISSVDGLVFDGVSAGVRGTDAGEYDVTFSGVTVNETKDNDGNYVVTETINGKLIIRQRTDLIVSLEGSSFSYDGTAKAITNKPTTNAPTGTTTYSYSFEESGTYVSDLSSLTKTDVGTYTVYVNATNPNYSNIATTTATLIINKADNPMKIQTTAALTIDGHTLDLSGLISDAAGNVSYAIDGDAGGCMLSGSILKSGNATGTCKITVTAAENEHYLGASGTITVTLTDKDTQALTFAEKKVTKTWGDVPFINALSGAKTKVTYTVTAGTEVASVAADGTVTILKSGTATITATAEETLDVAGATASYTLTVNKADPTVTAPTAKEDLIANGSAQELIVAGTVVGGEMQYALGADATTAPAAGWNTAIPTGTAAGTYYAWYKVVGDENHKDTIPACVTVTIAEAPQKTDIGKAKISAEDQEYTGKEIKPKLTVKLNGKKLKEKKDYIASFKFNKDIGKATVTITGTGDYTGTATGSFLIIPKKVASPKLTAEKGKKDALTLTWKAGKGIDGYEIEYGLKKDFKGAKKIKLKGAKNDEYEIKKLTAKKTYYVRIRAWKKSKGKMYYSAWSKALSKKVK